MNLQKPVYMSLLLGAIFSCGVTKETESKQLTKEQDPTSMISVVGAEHEFETTKKTALKQYNTPDTTENIYKILTKGCRFMSGLGLVSVTYLAISRSKDSSLKPLFISCIASFTSGLFSLLFGHLWNKKAQQRETVLSKALADPFGQYCVALGARADYESNLSNVLEKKDTDLLLLLQIKALENEIKSNQPKSLKDMYNNISTHIGTFPCIKDEIDPQLNEAPADRVKRLLERKKPLIDSYSANLTYYGHLSQYKQLVPEKKTD